MAGLLSVFLNETLAQKWDRLGIGPADNVFLQ